MSQSHITTLESFWNGFIKLMTVIVVQLRVQLLGNVSALSRGQDLPFLKAQGQTSSLNGSPSAAAAGLRKTAQKGSFYDFEAKVRLLFSCTGSNVTEAASCLQGPALYLPPMLPGCS